MSSSWLLPGSGMPVSATVSPSVAFGALINQYASTGTMVSATSSDAIRAIVTVTANGVKISPVVPVTKMASGRNTATVVIVDAVTAAATSRTPVVIAAILSSPREICLLMFSMTTIESSTTRPIAIVIAPSVMMLSE